MRLIGAAGVPAGAVFDTLELMNDPSLAERGIMQTVEHPTTGTLQDAGLAGALRRHARRGSSRRRCWVSTVPRCSATGSA